MKIRREITVSLILTLVLAGTGLNVYYNVLRNLLVLERVSNRQGDINRIIGGIRLRKEMTDALTRKEAELRSFRESMPVRQSYPEFVEKLHEIGRRTGVEISLTSLTPFKKAAEGELFEVLALKVPVKGAYKTIRNYILEVERVNRMLKLTHLRMIKSEVSRKSPGDKDVLLELGFSIYFRKDQI